MTIFRKYVSQNFSLYCRVQCLSQHSHCMTLDVQEHALLRREPIKSHVIIGYTGNIELYYRMVPAKHLS